jgi:hypothetical protein
MKKVKDLVSLLLRSGKIGPSPESALFSRLETQLGDNLPSDFTEFIRLCGGMQLAWGLNFFLYPGLRLKNINEIFSRPSHPFTYPEFDSAYLFASSGEHMACLGVDLSSKKFGWIFSYVMDDTLW